MFVDLSFCFFLFIMMITIRLFTGNVFQADLWCDDS